MMAAFGGLLMVAYLENHTTTTKQILLTQTVCRLRANIKRRSG
jgi:hypothetical protein